MTKSETVTAYACTQCHKLYAKRDDAEACCTCRSCGKKLRKSKDWSDRACARCLYGGQLRNARSEVRRQTELLEGAERRLQRLLDEGKPK